MTVLLQQGHISCSYKLTLTGDEAFKHDTVGSILIQTTTIPDSEPVLMSGGIFGCHNWQELTVRDAVSNGTVGGTAASAAGAGDHGRVPTKMREESLTSYSGPAR